MTVNCKHIKLFYQIKVDSLCIYLCVGGLWEIPKKEMVKFLGESPKVEL